METPEKIFICNYGSKVSYEWHSESEFEAKGHNDIEYIRKDAFIEKACDWLSKHAKKYYFNKERDLGTEELVEDFKLSMEMWYI